MLNMSQKKSIILLYQIAYFTVIGSPYKGVFVIKALAGFHNHLIVLKLNPK